MRCYPIHLEQHLEKGLTSLYLLYGTEPFLIEESAKLIRQKIAEYHPFLECVVFNLESNGDFNKLDALLTQPSLFTSIRLIDIRFKIKLNSKEMQQINQILLQSNTSHYFLVQMGPLSKQNQQAPWFIEIQQKGTVVPHWGLSSSEFSKWVSFQAKKRQLRLTPPAFNLLLYATEGNTLAASQELNRLALLYLEAENAVEMDYIERQSEFDVFDLCTAAITLEAERTVKIVCRMNEDQSVAPQLILWALAQTLRVLLRCTTTTQEEIQRQFLQQAGILSSLHPIYLKALQSPYALKWSSLLSQLFEADKQLKSGETSLATRTIFDICLKLATP